MFGEALQNGQHLSGTSVLSSMSSMNCEAATSSRIAFTGGCEVAPIPGPSAPMRVRRTACRSSLHVDTTQLETAALLSTSGSEIAPIPGPSARCCTSAASPDGRHYVRTCRCDYVRLHGRIPRPSAAPHLQQRPPVVTARGKHWISAADELWRPSSEVVPNAGTAAADLLFDYFLLFSPAGKHSMPVQAQSCRKNC